MTHPYRIAVPPPLLDLLHTEVLVAIEVSGGKESTAGAFATIGSPDTRRLTNRKKVSHGQ